MDPRARFDDLVAGTAFELSEPVGDVVAHRPQDVVAALRAAEQAAAQGSWVAGYVAYEAAAGLDPGVAVTSWPPGHPFVALPLVWFGVFARRTEVAVAQPRHADATGDWRLDRDEGWHRRAVGEIRDGIAAGSYYQVNLTARLTGTVEDADELYAQLCSAQRGSYHALLHTGAHTIVSSSPELFFARDGSRVTTRPMKGTAARGRWPGEDRRQHDRLRRSGKERAENAMIVDLLRNDLARVAEVGTVRVPKLFSAERFPTVWQLTSTVQAEVAADVDLAQLFTALFPSGSITGAPKRAAMSAIADLEQRPRGIYCGAVGFLEPGRAARRARFAVGIRTITRDDASGYAEYGTGGGITWSSRPDEEWAELQVKARVLAPSTTPQSLFETLRFDPAAGLVHADRHLRRLAQSAEYFGLPVSEHGVVMAAEAAVSGRTTVARVRIVLQRDATVRVDVADFVADTPPVKLAVADSGVRSDDVLLFHKHGDRRRYDEFRASHPEADDVVLWNERGEVTETTIANLAVQLGGAWYTPALSCGLLPGIERGRLIENGALLERRISLAELHAAQSLAVLNSLRGWRPAELVTRQNAPKTWGSAAGVRAAVPTR